MIHRLLVSVFEHTSKPETNPMRRQLGKDILLHPGNYKNTRNTCSKYHITQENPGRPGQGTALTIQTHKLPKKKITDFSCEFPTN